MPFRLHPPCSAEESESRLENGTLTCDCSLGPVCNISVRAGSAMGDCEFSTRHPTFSGRTFLR